MEIAAHGWRDWATQESRPVRFWLPMVIMMSGVALNAALNWVLIYGNLGAPAMGLAGAGVATLAARCFDLLALWFLLKADRSFRPNWPAHWWGRLEWVRIREILHIGVPASGQLIFELGAFMMATWMMGWLGTVPLAAHQIALSCAAMTFMFPLGLSMATSMRVSQVLGAGRKELVRPIGFGSYGMACAVMGIFGLVFWLAGPAIAHCFVDDAAVVTMASQLLAMAALFQLFDGGQVVGVALLRGMADMKVPTAITFVAYRCVMLPLAYWWGVHAGNPVGVWRALVAGLAGAAIFLAWRFVWKTREIITR